MMQATERLITTGKRWLQMSDRLCQLPAQTETSPRFEQLTIDPMQQFSQQLGEILPAKQRVTPSGEGLPETSTPAIATAPQRGHSQSVQPNLSHLPARWRSQSLAQKKTSISLPPLGERRSDSPDPRLFQKVGDLNPAPTSKAVFSQQSNNGSPDPPDLRLFQKVEDLNLANFGVLQLPSVNQMLRVMAALSLTQPIASPHPSPGFSDRQVNPLAQGHEPMEPGPSARSSPVVKHQPNQAQPSLAEPRLQLSQSASALARVLEANVVAGVGSGEWGVGNRGKGEGGKGKGEGGLGLIPENVDASGAALRADQALLVEEILAELSDRLELDFIRTYGTSGGS